MALISFMFKRQRETATVEACDATVKKHKELRKTIAVEKKEALHVRRDSERGNVVWVSIRVMARTSSGDRKKHVMKS